LIRREGKGKEGNKNMEWTPIRKTQFTSVLAKILKWKSLGRHTGHKGIWEHKRIII
jgi:hypothetical protein